jgi:tetratricopeptide (TPR) repeat protein
VYLGTLGLFLLIRGSAVGWSTTAPFFVDNPLVTLDAPHRIANAFVHLGFYGYKMIWPRTLSIDWAYDQLPVFDPALAALLALVLLAAWVGVAWLLWKRSTAGLFLWVAIAAGFAVTGNVLVIIGTNFAERLAYLPLAFACGLAGYGLSRVGWSRSSITAAVVIIALLLGFRAGIRSADFRSSTALYEATAAAAPRAVKSLTTLANIRLRQEKRPDLAVPILERVVKIWPDYPRALSSLAEAYALTGNRTGALEMDRRAREAAERLQSQGPQRIRRPS